MIYPLRSLVLMMLMIAAASLAVALKPSKKVADLQPAISLQQIVPTTFGEWREEKQSSLQIVDPEQKQLLDTIYSQMLARTYVNDKGYRIMLSLAYGGDQSRDMQVHRPEVCYAAQGFKIAAGEKFELKARRFSIPAMRLEAHLNARTEPVIYWIRVGSKLVRGNVELGLARLSYGLQGQIADGLLFRVSSIDPDTSRAYSQQEKFINDLIEAMPPENRKAILGDLREESTVASGTR